MVLGFLSSNNHPGTALLSDFAQQDVQFHHVSEKTMDILEDASCLI
jgi:hypothetical protein